MPTNTAVRFALGQLVATPGALALLEASGRSPTEYLARHVSGDWGDLSPDDKSLNDEALCDGSRILSSYLLPNEEKIWIITEATDDKGFRPATTILLPNEY